MKLNYREKPALQKITCRRARTGALIVDTGLFHSEFAEEKSAAIFTSLFWPQVMLPVVMPLSMSGRARDQAALITMIMRGPERPLFGSAFQDRDNETTQK